MEKREKYKKREKIKGEKIKTEKKYKKEKSKCQQLTQNTELRNRLQVAVGVKMES